MTSADPRKASNFRVNSFATLVMLLLEIGIGMGVNLLTALPAHDTGKSLFAAYGSAVTNGPLILTIHALLGTLIAISGATALVRAIKLRSMVPIVISGIALLAILAAWLSGSAFVGAQANGASLAMAMASVIATFCYALILFIRP